METQIEIKVNAGGLDKTIEKANRLVGLLREAQNIVGSLYGLQRNQSDRGFDFDSFSRKMNREIQSHMTKQDKTEEYQNVKETFDEMSSRYSNNTELFIRSEVLRVFYEATDASVRLEALKLLAAQQ